RRSGRSLKAWRHDIPEYLRYYNQERPHMALNMQSPLEVVRSY
ncbi:MAG: transposase, partial [Candidatus Kerfeldbacteria bacterium]|nr:transposase [Candidatus Kerfeldbacteria bacterium]MBI5466436.1 transposase [Candidatus Kerfeldbacteria bacterium]